MKAIRWLLALLLFSTLALVVLALLAGFAWFFVGSLASSALFWPALGFLILLALAGMIVRALES